MNTRITNIEIEINGEAVVVSLKWLRGASRYNNGGNKNGTLLNDKYPLRVMFGTLKFNLINVS